MATHSSILAWRIPWTEEPGGLEFMRLSPYFGLWNAVVLLRISVIPINMILSSDCKECSDLGSISGLGRSPRGGHGNPPQYSCLENLMDRRAWQATVHRVTKKLDMTKQLSSLSGLLSSSNATV